jgi:DNA-binding response OmpR family regulator
MLTQPLAALVADGGVPPGALVVVEAGANGDGLALEVQRKRSPAPRVESSRPVVLAVDENVPLLKMLEHALAGADVAPLIAESAAHARELAAQHRLDLAIVDLVLPDGDGLALALELLRAHPRLQVIVSSGMEMTADETALCERQDFHVLRKPFLPADVVRVVRDRLERSSAAGG